MAKSAKLKCLQDKQRYRCNFKKVSEYMKMYYKANKQLINEYNKQQYRN